MNKWVNKWVMDVLKLYPMDEFFRKQGLELTNMTIYDFRWGRIKYKDDQGKELELELCYDAKNIEVNYMALKQKVLCESLGKELVQFIKENDRCSMRFYLNGKASTKLGMPF